MRLMQPIEYNGLFLALSIDALFYASKKQESAFTDE